MKLFVLLLVFTLTSSSLVLASPETQKNNKKIFGFLKKWKENKREKKRIKQEIKDAKHADTPFMQELERWDSVNADQPVASKGRCGVLDWQVAYIIIHLHANDSQHELVWHSLPPSVLLNNNAKPMKNEELKKIKLVNQKPRDGDSEHSEYNNHLMSKDLAVQLMIEAEKRGLCQ